MTLCGVQRNQCGVALPSQRLRDGRDSPRAFIAARFSPRALVGAKTRTSQYCPARPGSKLHLPSAPLRSKPVCRLRGGKGGGPKGERNGAYRTGRYTADAKAERQQLRLLLRELHDPIDSGQ
jgi:hypothetical protein